MQGDAQAIAAQAPKNLEEADEYAGSGKADAVNKHWEKLGKPMPTYYTKGRAA